MRTSTRSLTGRALGLVMGFVTLACASTVSAQPRFARPVPPRPQTAVGPQALDGSLRSRLGLEVETKLLSSPDVDTVLRGIARARSLGTKESIDALLEKLELGGPATSDPRVRLEAVRALAGFATRENVRSALVKEAQSQSDKDVRGSTSPLAGLARATAALALAKAGEKKGLSALASAIQQEGAAAESAERALRAYPPASLEAFLEGKKKLTPAIAKLLGDLGDLRAIERLRQMLAESDVSAKLAAGVALAKLGDEAPLVAAREWVKSNEPKQRRAGTQVLVSLRTAEAPTAINALLGAEGTRDDGLRLALEAPSPELATALAALLPVVADDVKPRVVAALGRAGGAKAVSELATLLEKPELSTPAAFALALASGKEAREVIEKRIGAAKTGAPRRLALRAGVVRAIALGDEPKGLRAALLAIVDEKAADASDRAVAAFGLVSLGEKSASFFLEAQCAQKGACGPEIVAAIARAKLGDSSADLDWFADALERATAADKTPALLGATLEDAAARTGLGLLARPTGGLVPTSRLAMWAESGGAIGALAARALPSRVDEAVRPRIKRLLAGSDPVVRAHIALGLAKDPEASSVSLLTNAYRFEDDPAVRRAIVRGLAGRKEEQRTATLELARDYDPDEGVRTLARAAFRGRTLELGRDARSVGATSGVLWINIAANDGKASTLAEHLAARVTRPDGLALPLVADPDGVLLAAGIPPGNSQIILATPDEGTH